MNGMELYGDFALRLLVAGLMGVAIGLEREYRAKEAGYRTHFLVALGSALMMIVSQYGFTEVLKAGRTDMGRIPAGVVSGIGFIGAGTIILQKQIVRGLTTAAGIWATSGIGLAIGAGMYMVGILSTLFALAGLEVLSVCFKSMGMRNMMVEFLTRSEESLKQVTEIFRSKDYIIVSYEMKEYPTPDQGMVYQVSMVIKAKRMNEEGLLLLLLQDFPDVTVKKIL